MKISAMVRYSEVLEALGVTRIAGSLFSDPYDLVEFPKADVDDDMAADDLTERGVIDTEEVIECERCSECEGDEDLYAPPPAASSGRVGHRDRCRRYDYGDVARLHRVRGRAIPGRRRAGAARLAAQ